jgi:hypothetical protein
VSREKILGNLRHFGLRKCAAKGITPWLRACIFVKCMAWSRKLRAIETKTETWPSLAQNSRPRPTTLLSTAGRSLPLVLFYFDKIITNFFSNFSQWLERRVYIASCLAKETTLVLDHRYKRRTGPPRPCLSHATLLAEGCGIRDRHGKGISAFSSPVGRLQSHAAPNSTFFNLNPHCRAGNTRGTTETETDRDRTHRDRDQAFRG